MLLEVIIIFKMATTKFFLANFSEQEIDNNWG